jgi:choline-sulfatase
MHNRPNILVFMTDDHGHWAAGFAGNRELHTPSLDYLAATGACFTNAFTPCPVCSPARASFWTGLIPSAHGVHDHIADPALPGLDGQTTLAMELQRHGYRTGLCGKWHGHATGQRPQPGFDTWFSQWGNTTACFGDQPFSDNGQRRAFYGQQAPIITDAAVGFLRQSAAVDQLFFLFVGYTDTHAPFRTLPERLVSKYRQAALSEVPRGTFSSEHGVAKVPMPQDEAVWREQVAQYYASVEMIDSQVGRILDELESRQILEQTLIVYVSDHGHMNGHHGLVGKGNATTPQNFLEESIRVPLVVRLPGLAGSGVRLDLPVDHCDLHATLLDAAGVAAPQERGRPGRSYLQALRGIAPPDWRNAQICEYGNARMIRSADGLKLIQRYPGPNGHPPDELYDLDADPLESVNRIACPHLANRRAELERQLTAFFAQHEHAELRGTARIQQMVFNPDEPWRRRPISPKAEKQTGRGPIAIAPSAQQDAE